MDGPWSQGARAGQLIFTSGQVPVIPESGVVVAGGAREHAGQSLKNMLSIVEAGGGSLQTILKTTLFLCDYADFHEANGAYLEFFDGAYPARTCITARELPIIHGVKVLTIIEGIAFIPG